MSLWGLADDERQGVRLRGSSSRNSDGPDCGPWGLQKHGRTDERGCNG